jgi:two-component system, NtrC family, sensor kinase
VREPARILFVDDEPNVLRAIERLFLDEEYEVLTAPSGDEGLRVLESASPVPVVVSDYRMPGMNGVSFLREVCRRWPGTVRIVLSGFADTAAVVAAINEGQIFRFVPKPWDDHELKEAVASALDRHDRQQDRRRPAEASRVPDVAASPARGGFGTPDGDETRPPAVAGRILEALPFAVLAVDPSGTVIYGNPRAVALLGEGGRSLAGRDRREVLDEDLNALVERAEHGAAAEAPPGARSRAVPMDGPAGRAGIVLVIDGSPGDA